MKRYEDSAREIVRRVVEDGDDFSVDLKDVEDLGQDDQWYQIGGDANPWIWGGSWYNPERKELIHFEGIDQSQNREVDYQDIEVPQNVVVKVTAKVHDPYLDTDEAKEDPKWHHDMLFREEMEMDRLFDQYKIAKADFINKRKQHTFQRVHIDEQLPYQWRRYENECPTGLPDEVWAEMSVPNKIDELCQYFGWGDYSSAFDMNEKEAQALLGSHNI
jgi:hypothetical protein